MLLRAPAKINLTLKILSKRADGYHEISSLMRAIRLFDEVEVTTGQNGDVSCVRIRTQGTSPFCLPSCPDGPENLAYRAAGLALKSWGGVRGIDIALDKHIPVAAGLGGGSADAAAVLLGLARELKPEAGIAEVAALGAALGADVPFCVYSCAEANPFLGYKGAAAAIAEGIGEKLSLIGEPENAFVLLVKPAVEVKTGDVYALFDKMAAPRPAGAPASGNDLEAVCAEAHPVVSGTLDALKKLCGEAGAGGATVQLSGSGPTVYAYFRDTEKTDKAGQILNRAKEAFPGMFVHLTAAL